MSEIKLEVGQRVRLRNGEYDEIVPGNKPWKLKRKGLCITNGGRASLAIDEQYDVVEILPPEPVPTVEIGKWYPCRDGVHEGKVLEAGLPGDHCLVGVMREIKDHSAWVADSWTCLGAAFSDKGHTHDYDLMLAPPEPKRHTVTRWFNFYLKNGKDVSLSISHKTRAGADEGADKDRVACVPCTFEFTEGQGLS